MNWNLQSLARRVTWYYAYSPFSLFKPTNSSLNINILDFLRQFIIWRVNTLQNIKVFNDKSFQANFIFSGVCILQSSRGRGGVEDGLGEK